LLWVCVRAGGVELGELCTGLGELLVVVGKDDAAILRTLGRLIGIHPAVDHLYVIEEPSRMVIFLSVRASHGRSDGGGGVGGT
jgi:hypothetical protein